MVQRITISIPDDINTQLLQKVGKGHISQYMVELARKALQEEEEKLEKEYLLILEDEGSNETWNEWKDIDIDKGLGEWE